MSDVELMSETELQEAVIMLARYRDWLWYHTHDSRRSNAGFPDLVLVRGERLIFAELKSEKGRTTPNQREWLDSIGDVAAAAANDTWGKIAAPIQAFLWRPSDLRSGRIAEALR